MQNLHRPIMLALFILALVINSSSGQTQDYPYDHTGPVLSLPIKLSLIWYGHWTPPNQTIILDFLNSLSSSNSPSPSVSEWWSTVALYTDQTNSTVTRSISLSSQFHDSRYSNGKSLTRMSMQRVILNAVKKTKLPLDPAAGMFLVLTSGDVVVEGFCKSACGFHQFTFPSLVGAALPYAWVGDGGARCPKLCSNPFVLPDFAPKTLEKVGPPNGEVGIDAMVSVIAHELAEASTDPLNNGWYAGDQVAPVEIADMCLGIYGTGGYTGVMTGSVLNGTGPGGRKFGYNLNGVDNRKFLVQWVWNHVTKSCYGPNAIK